MNLIPEILPKGLNKKHFLFIFFIGVLCIIIAIPTGDTKNKNNQKTKADTSEVHYRVEMEDELEEMLSQVYGIGKVQVMISLKTSEKNLVEKDQSLESDSSQETTVYNQESSGIQSPYVNQTEYPEVEGVLVIADGGDNAVIIEMVKEAVQALFDVDTHKIMVMKRKS